MVTRRFLVSLLVAMAGLVAISGSRAFAGAVLQGEVDPSPEATPQIKLIKPAEAAPGDEVTVVIEGANFSRGAYVSFSHPTVHAVSTRRVSVTQLEAKIQIGKKTQPGPITLYVSNPASVAVEGPFTIKGEPGPAPATEEPKPTEVGAPEVTAVDPPRATPGSETSLKITGKNFANGTKVSFSNPGIRVLETNAGKSTELTARIQIAADAPTGLTGLFVVNPDDREVEIPFEVAGGSPAAPATPAKAPTASATTGAASQRFEVYNLGDVVNILYSPNKPKGTLTVAGGKLAYQEGGKEIFSTPVGDIKEIDVNTVFGVNTGTFHIILSSGKSYNFMAGSLRPADSQAMVESLRRALH